MTASASCRYSFSESVNAVHPYYVIRMLGGVLFLTGGLIMCYNLIRTVRSPTTERRDAPLGAFAVAAE